MAKKRYIHSHGSVVRNHVHNVVIVNTSIGVETQVTKETKWPLYDTVDKISIGLQDALKGRNWLNALL